jgi:hypothetical protein
MTRVKRKTAKKTAKPKPRKIPKKTAKPKPRKIPQPNGKGALYAGGVPGNKGGGRPSLAFKQWCESLLDDPKCRTEVERILCNREHPAFAQMFRTIADRAHGKADQTVKVKHSLDEAAKELQDILARGFARRAERENLIAGSQQITMPGTQPMIVT